MAQNIPGVEAYGSPMVDIGAHFTAGVNAGSGIRRNADARTAQKEDMAQRTLEAQNRDARAKEENEIRRKEAEARIAAEEARRKQQQLEANQKLEQHFGPDLVRTEEGGIDVQGSAMQQLARQQKALQAKALGLDEGLNRRDRPDADSSLRETPEYGQGFNQGQLATFQQDQLTLRAQEANQLRVSEGQANRDARIEAAKLKAGGGAGEDGKTVEQDLNGIKVPGVMNKGRFTPLSGSALEEYAKQKRRASQGSGTNAGPTIRATFDRDGNRIK